MNIVGGEMLLKQVKNLIVLILNHYIGVISRKIMSGWGNFCNSGMNIRDFRKMLKTRWISMFSKTTLNCVICAAAVGKESSRRLIITTTIGKLGTTSSSEKGRLQATTTSTMGLNVGSQGLIFWNMEDGRGCGKLFFLAKDDREVFIKVGERFNHHYLGSKNGKLIIYTF